jgi:hypothetical protein
MGEVNYQKVLQGLVLEGTIPLVPLVAEGLRVYFVGNTFCGGRVGALPSKVMDANKSEIRSPKSEIKKVSTFVHDLTV